MSEDIERHVVRKFEICQRLGKGVSFPSSLALYVLCTNLPLLFLL